MNLIYAHKILKGRYGMLLTDLAKLLNAEVLSFQENLTREVKTACGSDLMSDVLAYAMGKQMLITGLVNPQVIRTAEMLDIFIVVFVRGKKPTPEMLELAEEKHMTLMSTERTMYQACGILYENGIGRV